MENVVTQLWNEYQAMSAFLTGKLMASELNDYDRSFRKVLLLASASYFEDAITTLLVEFVNAKSGGDTRISSFLKKGAIEKRFSQLFDWGSTDDPKSIGKNANKFFSLFGQEFRATMDNELKADRQDSTELTAEKKAKNDSISAFLTLGHHRNILVHSNFAAYDYQEKTTAEIYELFQAGLPFIEFLRVKLT